MGNGVRGAGQRRSEEVKATSPAGLFRAAVAAGQMTPAERAAFRSQLAQVAAQDDARRSAPSPQAELELAA